MGIARCALDEKLEFWRGMRDAPEKAQQLPISPLYLPDFSPVSPRYLPYIPPYISPHLPEKAQQLVYQLWLSALQGVPTVEFQGAVSLADAYLDDAAGHPNPS